MLLPVMSVPRILFYFHHLSYAFAYSFECPNPISKASSPPQSVWVASSAVLTAFASLLQLRCSEVPLPYGSDESSLTSKKFQRTFIFIPKQWKHPIVWISMLLFPNQNISGFPRNFLKCLLEQT